MGDLDPDHEIVEAAQWLLATPKAQRPRPAVVELRARFPQIGAVGACHALAIANRVRGGADAVAS